MIRKIIKNAEEQCNGCGACAAAWTFGSMLPGAKCPSAMYCFASSTVMSSSHFSSGFP